MSNSKSKNSASAPEEARVEVAVPRGGEREDPNVFVGINGVSYLLPRGRRSAVPAAVAAELARAERARDALDATRGRLQRSAP